MWKLSRGRVLLDEPPEEEDGLPELPPPALAAAPAQEGSETGWLALETPLEETKAPTLETVLCPRAYRKKGLATPGSPRAGALVQGASFRGWKEVTSLFNKDDEQHLLESRKPPKSKGANSRLKEELKTEKKSGFWDSLVLKQNTQSKKPDEIEGWEPPRLALEDAAADSGDTPGSCPPWPEWEDATKGSTKYTSLASSAGSSRWSLRSAGKLVSIRRQSKGHLRDGWEEAE
ncbi:testis development-related protein isoform X1 [Lepus europaeus]|uniref:testis development-related protein isoform X1 n=1 Tax=Lepus europaeus TaxID=9983 RepID=UPI002B49EC28|nr:testis development-related protein isoform X1 [Lepus europaeus]